MIARTCAREGCGAEFHVDPDSHAERRKARRYCSKRCGTIASNSTRYGPRPTKVCEREACGKTYSKRKGQGTQDWEKQKFCSIDCAHIIRKGHLVEDVEWIIDHDHPESVAERVGYTRVPDLADKLRDLHRPDLASKLMRNFERYHMSTSLRRDVA